MRSAASGKGGKVLRKVSTLVQCSLNCSSGLCVQDLKRLEPVRCCLSPSGMLYITSFGFFGSPQTCSACALHFGQAFFALPLFALYSTRSSLYNDKREQVERLLFFAIDRSNQAMNGQLACAGARATHDVVTQAAMAQLA